MIVVLMPHVLGNFTYLCELCRLSFMELPRPLPRPFQASEFESSFRLPSSPSVALGFISNLAESDCLILGVWLPVRRLSEAIRNGDVPCRVSYLCPPCKADKMDRLGTEIRLFDD